ncbi:hypothetical protein JVU11DRAFT_2985 [Chiua virens]|nr:hypothetical protein JVU11DRAFT_2985 [Chiua virens]
MPLSSESANRQADYTVDKILQFIQRESDNFCAELCETDREEFKREYINAKLRACLSEEGSPSVPASNRTNTLLQTSSEVKCRSDSYIQPRRLGTPPSPRLPLSETTGTSPASNRASTRLQRKLPPPPPSPQRVAGSETASGDPGGGSHRDRSSQFVRKAVSVSPQPTRRSRYHSSFAVGSLASGPATSASSSLNHQGSTLESENVKDEQVPDQDQWEKWLGDGSTRINFVEISHSNVNGLTMNNGGNSESSTFRAVNHKMAPLLSSKKHILQN